MPGKTIIQINNLSVQIGNSAILSNINLDIGEGTIIGLLGPSGAGKTTLVRSIMGMCRFKGEIKISGFKIPALMAASEIGYMAQSDALYEELSALDNLLFFGSLFDIKAGEAKARAMELLKFVGLEKDKNKPVKNFSGGMKRRLSLAIALIHSPKVLILDEPTVGIDPLLRKKFWDEFLRLKKEGCTIFVTTHVMDEASHCDEIMLMRGGHIIAGGTLPFILSESKTENMEDAFLYYSMQGEEH
ncbi:MAG TPA: ABC transporter ATP-binding protein [Ruminiclostridium sp.]|nr:ABC transporter ATP-binding protein [Ruminiclostridium sp.]